MLLQRLQRTLSNPDEAGSPADSPLAGASPAAAEGGFPSDRYVAGEHGGEAVDDLRPDPGR